MKLLNFNHNVKGGGERKHNRKSQNQYTTDSSSTSRAMDFLSSPAGVLGRPTNSHTYNGDGDYHDNNNNNNDDVDDLRAALLSFDPESGWTNGTNRDVIRNKRDQTRCCSFGFMKCLGNTFAIISSLAFLVIVPAIAYHAMLYDQARPDFVAFYSAGAFVLITLIISTKLIYNHLTHWYMPDVQKYVVRILWMVPLYAIQSWLSLRFHNARLYIDTLRDLYEAYVIQSFAYFLMELMGGEDSLVQILQDKDPHYGVHLSIFRYFIPPWEMGFEFMANCKYGVLQYVVAKIFASIATATLEPLGLFDEGQFSWTKGYIYISFIINLSQMWALYCLVKFYHATHENLASPINWRPLGKFLCIKGVVFFTWWQGVGIAVLKSYNVIGDIGQWDVNDVANGLQDYLICVEMFCFAIAHSFTFTHKEYLPGRIAESNRNHTSRQPPPLLSLFSSRQPPPPQSDNARHSLLTFSSSRQREQQQEEEADISLDYTEFRPPIIRTLNTPMGFRDALWSSTVPNETFHDIRRFRNGGIDQDSNDSSSDIGMLRNVSMQHAESV